MSSLKGEMKEVSYIWFWMVGLIVLAGPIFFALDAAGIVGTTIVERAVFENSYQKKAAEETKSNTLRAQLAQLQVKLADERISDETRTELESQVAAIRVMMAASQ